MRILLYGLNYAPEEIGIGKYSGEMISALADMGHVACVVTTPPYYPHWEIKKGFHGLRYQHEQEAPDVSVTRCPLWVPKQVSGLKRVLHLASFAISSLPVILWKAVWFRPHVIITVEPAAFCMPATWVSSRLVGAKCWLHVQDFEVDAAFELGILKSRWLKKLVLATEALLMRRFDVVSSISPNMLLKLVEKGVAEKHVRAFPNWVDCKVMRPIHAEGSASCLSDGTELTAGGSRKSFGIPVDKFVVMYAGNIGAKQGIEIILDAAEMLQSINEIHFVICGDGANHSTILKQAERLPNVQMLPLQPSAVFNQLLNCADVHLLPQRAGAADLVMPSKLTGMLATGRPVIACADPGTQIAGVVTGHGEVVSPGDAVAFSKAIVHLSINIEQCNLLGRNARQYAVDHLSKEAILHDFEQELVSLAGERKKLAITISSELTR